MKIVVRVLLILIAIAFELNAPCRAQSTEHGASKPSEQTATGMLSRQFSVCFEYLIISLEGQKGGFYVRSADFQRWNGNSLFGKNVTITYKETKLEPDDKYTVSLVTAITSPRS